MSAAAPSSPAVVRSQSSTRRPQPANSPSDRPHRSQSTTTRPSGHPVPHSLPRPPPQPNLVNLGRRDFEQSNLANGPTTRRSESRDRAAPTPTRADSIRRGHQRYASDASAASAMPINGVATDASRSGNQAPQPRRRTSISAPNTGQWILGKTIGAGSMGKVKLAKQAESGESVAVKIVPRQSTDQHSSQADRERADHSKEVRTAREAAIVSLLNHPYICGMRDVVRTNYHWYMLFEYVNGGQMLDYIISHGRLKEKQARKFARQIASALDYCHRNSIVHRDLKIENILISKTGDIKIIDFGLSNLFSPKSLLKTFCGSLYFAAPELLQAKQYTGPEVDIWSFGIVLYVLVCGKVPFDDQSMPQLHAKIKKGHVDYPPWLSTECRNLIHRMLQTDPAQRITLSEIMTHPWLTKGFNTPPENYLPHREPVQLPLDDDIIERMTGFDFGSAEYIKTQLIQVLSSDEYNRAVRLAARKTTAQTPEMEKKRGMFDFYKRRNSISSREQLPMSSSEDLQRGLDPVNAYNPLISVYYLVREKRDREQLEANPGGLAVPQSPGEKPLKIPDLPAPEAAYTNSSTYEMQGENTGGRSRPRARTHGEDEVTDTLQKLNLNQPPNASPAVISPPPEHPKKESAAAGLLRRFSTRKYRNPDRDRTEPPPTPAVAVSGPGDPASNVPKRGFSVRRTRDKDNQSASHLHPSDANQPELLSPPLPNSTSSTTKKFKALGRSTSVNGADLRRRLSRRGRSSEDPGNPPPTSGSDRSSISTQQKPANDAASEDLSGNPRRTAASRTKSLGHARRESIQARRARREQVREANVPEETDAELAENKPETNRSPEVKPVFLKGLFSVSTTSSKPLSFIQADIIRVLDQLGVTFTEIKGGFKCRHVPSIEPKKGVDSSSSPNPPSSAGHRRRTSFAGGMFIRDRDRDEFREQQKTPHTPKSARGRPSMADRSYTNTDESDASGEDKEDRQPRSGRAYPPGETSTHVQNDYGGSMILVFEVLIVKVPLLQLHGIQFKKVDGGTWQYKTMAQTILSELRL